jgi:GTP cyclohydrolase I
MLDSNKCDPVLGYEIEAHLQKLGLSTPTTDLLNASPTAKIVVIRDAMTTILKTLGMDLTDDSLIDTPNRVAKMYVNEHYWGLHPQNFPKATLIENKMNYDEMLIEKDITVMSNCEHHLVTIEGKAHVAYMPNGKVIGLSKLNRVVEYFSHRPQVQERLTSQIFEALKYILGTENVAVVIDAKHYCVISRGVGDQTSHTVTSALGGAFRDVQSVRQEFLALARSK